MPGSKTSRASVCCQLRASWPRLLHKRAGRRELLDIRLGLDLNVATRCDITACHLRKMFSVPIGFEIWTDPAVDHE